MKNENDIADLNDKKVLIIRLSSLGDILLATPLLRTLKTKYHDIQIDFILKKQYQNVLMLNPHITNLYTYEKEKDKIAELTARLRQNKYDMIVDLQNNFRSAEIRNKLNADIYKFNKRTLDKFLLVNFKINRLDNAPQIPVRYASTVTGLELDEAGLEIFTESKPSLLLEGKEQLIGIAPGSRHFTKMWPKEYFEHCGNLLNESGYSVALFGGKEDIPTCKELAVKIKGSVNLSNADDILQTAADMKKCIALICNDSGMMHTASAVNIPVLAVYGSTVKEFGFTPYKNRNLILENKSLTCRPCSHIGRERCPKDHFRCMLEVTPEKAYEELMILIGRK